MSEPASVELPLIKKPFPAWGLKNHSGLQTPEQREAYPGKKRHRKIFCEGEGTQVLDAGGK
ncbi:MAG: hypothetical protein LBH43_12270 [Treponema sp.]|jgi:hypothetical protein|nr:hypothetical protein [Treponema sp.]